MRKDHKAKEKNEKGRAPYFHSRSHSFIGGEFSIYTVAKFVPFILNIATNAGAGETFSVNFRRLRFVASTKRVVNWELSIDVDSAHVNVVCLRLVSVCSLIQVSKV